MYTLWAMLEMIIWSTFTIATMVRISGVQISKKQNVQNKQLFRKLWICCKSDLHSVRNVGNDDLNYVCYG